MGLPDPIQGFTGLPAYPDAALIPDHLKGMYDFTITRTIMRFTDEPSRNAALPSPADGTTCWVDSTKSVYIAVAGSWTVWFQTVPVNALRIGADEQPGYLYVGDEEATGESSIRISRKVGASTRQMYMYVNTSGSVATILRDAGSNVVTFTISSDGRAQFSGAGFATRRIPIIEAGSVSVPALAAGATASYPITYPTGLFPATPRVFCMGHTRHAFGITSPTPDGCTINIANYSGGNAGAATVWWQAVYV